MSWGETLFLRKIIQGEKIFVASDSPVASASSGNWFKSKLNGTVRLMFDIQGGSSNVGGAYVDIIDEKKEIITTSSILTASNQTNTWREQITLDFPVYKNKKYSVNVRQLPGYLGHVHVINAFFCTQIIDANYFDIENEV